MLAEMLSAGSGGGGNSAGISYSFTASTTDTPTDVGFSPTKVLAYGFINSGGTDLRMLELDVPNSKVYLYINGQTDRVDRTSSWGSSFYVSGNVVHFKAIDSDWAKSFRFTAIKE